MNSLVSMPEIALLAKVSRQAVTNWRSRPASVTFPAPVDIVAGMERFDRNAVVEWLELTGRGKNPEARLDAPALAIPDAADLKRVVVLLALRAGISYDIGELSAVERLEFGESVDPHDEFLYSELREAADDDGVALYVDGLMETSFGPGDALARLYSTGASSGSRGLASELIALVKALADACRTHLGPDDVAIDLHLDPNCRSVASGFASAESHSNADREMLRHLFLEGISPDKSVDRCVRIVSVAGCDDAEALDRADEVALDLRDGQAAIIVGPASALCDRLTGDLYANRRKTLEMGDHGNCALVAALKLPRGLWKEAHRLNLGLWVLHAGGAGERVLAADLSTGVIDPPDLADDILGALEQTTLRAYRYGRAVPYPEVWTRDTVVLPGIRAVSRAVDPTQVVDRVVESTLVTRERIAGFDLIVAGRPKTSGRVPRSVHDLIQQKVIKLQRGTRISSDHLDEDGSIRVLSADPAVPHGRIDALVAADRFYHAARTEPGDVVFTASPPRAIVDEEGGALVAAPSRILRIIDSSRAAIAPRGLAAVINETAIGIEWKTWLIPEIPEEQVLPLEDALGGVADYLEVLRRHEAAARAIMSTVIRGAADGSITLDPALIERKAG